MSAQSDIDHPLCEECTDTLLDQLDHQLKVTTEELNDYSKQFTEKLDDTAEEDPAMLEKELDDLKLEESQLMQVDISISHKKVAKCEPLICIQATAGKFSVQVVGPNVYVHLWEHVVKWVPITSTYHGMKNI